METDKAPAYDGISAEHFKFYYPVIGQYLLAIMEARIRLQYFPQAWKKKSKSPHCTKSTIANPSCG